MVEAFKTQKKTGFFGTTKTIPKVSVAIDFPKERDMISLGHYAVRVSGDVESNVEVSINGGEWKVCRFSDGYHWFDWSPSKTGPYKLLARIRKGTSAWEISTKRTCVAMPTKGK